MQTGAASKHNIFVAGVFSHGAGQTEKKWNL